MVVEKIQRLFGRRPTTVSNNSPLLKYVDPRALFPESGLQRLGTVYGGWFIPAPADLNGDSVCYLAGAGEDISFDCAIAKRFGSRIRIVDPTPRAQEHFRRLEDAVTAGIRFPINNSVAEYYDITSDDLGLLSFLPYGLAGEDAELKFFLPKNPAHVSCSAVNLQKTTDYFTAQCHRLSTLMAQQGDEKVDLLKMDIEGAEYDVIADIVASRLLPRILLIEFDEAHTPLDGDSEARIQSHIQTLIQSGMRCVAVEGSNATFLQAQGSGR